MDLQKLMNEKFEALVASGKFDLFIEQNIEKLIKNLTEDYFREYSDFGKALKEHINAGLSINLNTMDLTKYNKVVTDIVKERLLSTVGEAATESITSAINSILDVLDKKEWLLSEVAQEFVKSLSDDDKEPFFHIRTSRWGTTYIHIDESEQRNYYDAQYELSIDKDGKLWNFSSQGRMLNPKKERVLGSFEEFLFKLYVAGVHIKIDRAACDEIIEGVTTSHWD